ncbi:hypothetical protein [Geodermatophilus sp. CPCC 206100]|uniref:hypothetical protein n=1 Tax=Geodermatophilus sp. CPCC 206100 TaxID=3020054 RepID=UPI003B0009C4
MNITVRTTRLATDGQIWSEVARVLDRRAAMKHPPFSLTVSDAVALGIARMYRSATLSGQVLDRFADGGTVDSDELVEAARFEQGFASAEGHAALRCLVLWVHDQTHRQAERRALPRRA